MKYEKLDSKIVFDEFFTIERARLRWQQFDGTMGKKLTRYVIRRGDSVGVIPVCGSKIILVNQFRYPAVRKGMDGYLWEIPAGMIDKGEEPLQTARRELREEIGIDANAIHPLISFFLSPGALDEMFHLFYVEITDCIDLKAIGGIVEEDENLKVEAFPIDRIMKMINENRIVDAKTIASLLFYLSTVRNHYVK